MKSHFYYIGCLARICANSPTAKNSFDAAKVTPHNRAPKPQQYQDALNYFGTLKDVLSEEERKQFDDVYTHALLLSIQFPMENFVENFPKLTQSYYLTEFNKGFKPVRKPSFLLSSVLVLILTVLAIWGTNALTHDLTDPFRSLIEADHTMIAHGVYWLSLDKETCMEIALESDDFNDPWLLNSMLLCSSKPKKDILLEKLNSAKFLSMVSKYRKDFDLACVDEAGNTLLHKVTNTECVPILAQFADINLANNEGKTPLEVRNEDRSLTLALIQNGAKLHRSVVERWVNDEEILTVMKEHRGEFDFVYLDENGNTLLHKATKKAIVATLLELGIDPMLQNNEELTALEVQLENAPATIEDYNKFEEKRAIKTAELQKRTEDLQKRIDEYNRQVTQATGRNFGGDPFSSALFATKRSAIEREEAAIEEDAKRLHEEGAALAARIEEYAMIIDLYVDAGCDVASIFRKVIADRKDSLIGVFSMSKLDLSELDGEGKTFLQTLIEKMQEEVAAMQSETNEKLLKTASEDEAVDIYREALQKRTQIEKYYIVVLARLIENGNDPNMKNSEGSTLLHISTENYLPLVTNMLVLMKADVNLQDVEGNTPLAYTAAKTLYDVDTRQTIWDIESMQLLLDNGADPWIADENGILPLFKAFLVGGMETSQLLMEHMKKTKDLELKELQDPDGRNAMFYARSAEIVKYLAEQGFSADITDADGNSPAQIAVAHLFLNLLGTPDYEREKVLRDTKALLEAFIEAGDSSEDTRKLAEACTDHETFQNMYSSLYGSEETETEESWHIRYQYREEGKPHAVRQAVRRVQERHTPG